MQHGGPQVLVPIFRLLADTAYCLDLLQGKDGSMDKSLPSLFGALAVLSAGLWIVFEAVGRGLDGANFKKKWWAQLVLKWGPFITGGMLGYSGEILVPLIELFGYVPKSPPTGTVAAMAGVVSGAGAVVYHSKFSLWINDFADRLLKSKKAAETAPPCNPK